MSTSTALVRRIAAVILGPGLVLTLSACGADESPGAATAHGNTAEPLAQESSATEPAPEPVDTSGNA